MTSRIAGLAVGFGFGFMIAWAQISDPEVIRQMLMLRDPSVFLIMGSAIVTAGAGTRVLRAMRMRSIVTREPIAWTAAAIEPRHIAGSAIFGAGWSVACTCPGPVAAMIGQGRFGGLAVGVGLLAGIALRSRLVRKRTAPQSSPAMSNTQDPVEVGR